MKAVSDMRKAELQQELDGWEVIYSSNDTVKELRSMVSHVRKEKMPKTEDDLTGLSGLKRDELHAKCKELMVPFTTNDTCGVLIYKIKQHIASTSEPKGTDVYGIGRHQGMTYRQIRTQYSEYSTWVNTTMSECGGSCHWELKRFHRYLNRDLSPESVPLTPTVKKEKDDLKSEVADLKNQIKVFDQRLRQENKGGTGSSSSDAMGVDQSNQPNDGMDKVLKAILQRLENLEMRENSKSESDSWSEVKEQPKE